jgi:hydrogenase maturation protease
MTDPARSLVIGVGNRDRGDDAIGPVVAGIVAERWPNRVDTAVVEGDLSTLPLLWSADQPVVVVDAAVLDGEAGTSTQPGTVIEFDGLACAWPVGGEGPPLSTHGIGLATAVELARRLDRLPDSLTVLAVTVHDGSLDHQAPLSRPLEQALDAIVTRIGVILNLPEPVPYPGNGVTSQGDP